MGEQMKNLHIILLMSIIFPVLCSGCSTTSDFDYVQKAIEEQIYPTKINSHFKISLGFFSLGVMKTIVPFMVRQYNLRPYLDEINNIQIGIYEIEKSSKPLRFNVPKNVEEKLRELGWHIFIRVREKEERVDCYFRELNELISSLYFIIQDGNDIVIMEVKGRFGRLIEKVIQERGLPEDS